MAGNATNQTAFSGLASTAESVKRLFTSRIGTLVLLNLFAAALLSVLSPQFLTQSNLTSVIVGMTYTLLLASGMTLVLVLAGIDLSVGSVLGLTGILTTLMLSWGVPVPLAIISGLALAATAGAINGIFIAKFKIAPFIVTLAMMSVARGLATVLTSGYFVSNLPREYTVIGQGSIAGIPIPVLVTIPLLFLFDYLLRRWRPLNQAFLIGANPAAAALSGIPVATVTFFGYVISAVLAGVAGIFMTSRLGMGFFQFGLGGELTAIAAAVIGGASLRGGSGSILGTSLGVLLLAIVNNGFVLLRGSPNWLNVMSGLILVVAVAADAYRQRRGRSA